MPSKSAVDPKIVEELTRLRKQVTAVGYVAFPQVHLLPHKRCLDRVSWQNWYLTCKCCIEDPLASHASSILNGTVYHMRGKLSDAAGLTGGAS